MDEATLYSNWYLGLGIAVVLIVAAAALLILVWFAARRILRLATAALGLVVQIKENTNSIWGLEQTNEVAVDKLLKRMRGWWRRLCMKRKDKNGSRYQVLGTRWKPVFLYNSI